MARYKIRNVGCDDITEKEFEFTDEQYYFLDKVFEELNEESFYQCMPNIFIEEMESDESDRC